MSKVQEIIDYLLPFLSTAGAYATHIQGRVGVQGDKSGATAFQQALSDADLTVQSFLEVVLLGKYPEVSFFSEEYAQSLNLKYFPEGKEIEVLLDPIDGTKSYIDGREHFQIIVTFHDHTELVGAILHMPRLGYTYTAVKGKGARKYTNDELQRGGTGLSYVLPKEIPSDAPVLLFNSPDVLARLAPHIHARDLVVEYVSNPGKFNSTDIIEGKSLANLHTPCQAIDGAAIGLVVEEAGGVVSDFNGKRPISYRESATRIVPNLLVSANKSIHEKVLALLKPE